MQTLPYLKKQSANKERVEGSTVNDTGRAGRERSFQTPRRASGEMRGDEQP